MKYWKWTALNFDCYHAINAVEEVRRMIQKLWLMLLGIARVGDGGWLTLLEAENSCLCWTLVAITMEAGQPMLSVPKTRKHSFAVL